MGCLGDRRRCAHFREVLCARVRERQHRYRRSRGRPRPVASVTQLMPNEIARVDRRLPLNRLCQQVEQGSTYLIAWKDDQPVGHAHIARRGTPGPPRDPGRIRVARTPALRDRDSARHAAEKEARVRGWDRISLSVSQEGNAPARLLYEQLGYVDAGTDPVRVSGTISLRGRPFQVDDTLVCLTKLLRAVN